MVLTSPVKCLFPTLQVCSLWLVALFQHVAHHLTLSPLFVSYWDMSLIAANDGSTVPASTYKESNWKARFRRSNGKDLVQFERYKLWAQCWNDLQEQK